MSKFVEDLELLKYRTLTGRDKTVDRTSNDCREEQVSSTERCDRGCNIQEGPQGTTLTSAACLKEVMLYTQVLKAGGECGVRASQST